jgi:hypothetical protein
VNDTPPTGGHGGHGSGGAGSPGPAPSGSPSPTPSPTTPDGCKEGEVHLAQPLLNGAVEPVTGLLDGLLGTDPSGVTASPSPSPSSPPAAGLSSVCVGIAPSPSVIPEVLP